jgi:hypothetical protein
MIDNNAVELFSVRKSCGSVVAAAGKRFIRHGFQVMRTFDLQLARASQSQCSCPHHGTELCDCQMIMLLIYGLQDLPVTLVCHGYDGWTHLSLVDSPEQRISLENLSIIEDILQSGQWDIFERRGNHHP